MITEAEARQRDDFPHQGILFDKIERLQYPWHRELFADHDALRGRIMFMHPFNGHDAQKAEDRVMELIHAHKMRHPRSQVKGMISTIHGEYSAQNPEHDYLSAVMDAHDTIITRGLGIPLYYFPELLIKESHSGVTRSELRAGATRHMHDQHPFVVVLDDNYPRPHRDYVETCLSRYASGIPIVSSLEEGILIAANLIDRDLAPHKDEND